MLLFGYFCYEHSPLKRRAKMPTKLHKNMLEVKLHTYPNLDEEKRKRNHRELYENLFFTLFRVSNYQRYCGKQKKTRKVET